MVVSSVAETGGKGQRGGGKKCPALFYKFFSTIKQNKALIDLEWTTDSQ